MKLEPVAWISTHPRAEPTRSLGFEPEDETLSCFNDRWINEPLYTEAQLKAAILEEREACAKVCEDMMVGGHEGIDDLAEELIHIDCAEAIRARKDEAIKG